MLEEFLKAYFEVPNVTLRFRPSFFPFTEPSMEVDVQCDRSGAEVKIGEGSDWLEILGCGMVHPNVIRNCGLDPDVYQGFAWGIGIDRIAMLKYGMPDLRAFFDADQRWLDHYGFRPLDLPTLFGGLSNCQWLTSRPNRQSHPVAASATRRRWPMRLSGTTSTTRASPPQPPRIIAITRGKGRCRGYAGRHRDRRLRARPA